jgi:hypothetical protein
MKIVCLFDVQALRQEQEIYAMAAWNIFMGETDPLALSGSALIAGDVDIAACPSRSCYSIGIDTTADAKIMYLKTALNKCHCKGIMPLEERFLEDDSIESMPLAAWGHMTSNGRFILTETDCYWLLRVGSKHGWICLPSDDWLGKFIAEYLVSTAPNAPLPWNEEAAVIAKRVFVEVGKEKALSTLDQFLATSRDAALKRSCQERLGCLEPIWQPEATQSKKAPAKTEKRPSILKRLFGKSKRECVQLICSQCQQAYNIGVDSFLVTADDVKDFATNQGAAFVRIGNGMKQAPALAMRFKSRLATEEEREQELKKILQVCKAIENGEPRDWRCEKCHAVNHYFPVMRQV